MFSLHLHGAFVGFIVNVLRQFTNFAVFIPPLIVVSFLKYLIAFLPTLQNIQEQKTIIDQVAHSLTTLTNELPDDMVDDPCIHELTSLFKSLILLFPS